MTTCFSPNSQEGHSLSCHGFCSPILGLFTWPVPSSCRATVPLPLCLQPGALLNWGPMGYVAIKVPACPKPHQLCWNVGSCEHPTSSTHFPCRTGCLGPEDFPASAMCLPGYPILGYQQAHPAPVPGASEPGLLMCPGPSPGAGLVVFLCSVPSPCSEPLGSVRAQGWAPGIAQLLAGGLWQGAELSVRLPSSSCSLPGLIQAVLGHCHCSPSFPGSVFSARLGHTKPCGPLILLDECFTMDYMRG